MRCYVVCTLLKEALNYLLTPKGILISPLLTHVILVRVARGSNARRLRRLAFEMISLNNHTYRMVRVLGPDKWFDWWFTLRSFCLVHQLVQLPSCCTYVWRQMPLWQGRHASVKDHGATIACLLVVQMKWRGYVSTSQTDSPTAAVESDTWLIGWTVAHRR